MLPLQLIIQTYLRTINIILNTHIYHLLVFKSTETKDQYIVTYSILEIMVLLISINLHNSFFFNLWQHIVRVYQNFRVQQVLSAHQIFSAH